MPLSESLPSLTWSVPAQALVETWYVEYCESFRNLARSNAGAVGQGHPGGEGVMSLREGKREGNMV